MSLEWLVCIMKSSQESLRISSNSLVHEAPAVRASKTQKIKYS